MKVYVIEPHDMIRMSDEHKEDLERWIKDHGLQPNTIAKIAISPEPKVTTFTLMSGVKWDEEKGEPVFETTELPMPMRQDLYPHWIASARIVVT